MKSRHLHLYIPLSLLLTVPSIPVLSRAQSVYVPLNNHVYRYIERFEAKGLLPGAFTGMKPFSRRETAEMLHEIRAREEKSPSLSRVDRELLKFYEEEFREELQQIDPSREIPLPETPPWLRSIHQKPPARLLYRNGRNLFEIKGEDFALFADIIAFQSNALADVDSLADRDEVYSYTTGIRLRGSLGTRLGFFIDARNTKEWGSRSYPEGRDVTTPGLGWVNNFGTHQFHDETTAYIIYRAGKLEFELGKNVNDWGHGFRGGLMLSDNATSYDLVKVKTRFWKLNFSHLFGSLQQVPRIVEQEPEEKSGRKKTFARKYIAAHRLEIKLSDGVTAGLQESVVYGQRGVELAYVNPVMFLRSAEHFLGDQDNALMGADIAVSVVEGWKWYGEMLIDDIFLSKLGTDWWGNKFGYTAGAFWTDPLGMPDASLRVEYTRIKPFVYTHRFPVNVYKHYNTGLGHPIKPNSREWYFSGTQRLTRKLFYRFEVLLNSHGANPPGRNVGGDIDSGFPNPGDEYIGFLEGDIERTRIVRFRVSYEMLRRFFFTAEAEFLSGSNFTINGVRGRNLTSNRIVVSLGLNH